MKYINNNIISFILIAALAVSCVDDYGYRIQMEKPQDVAASEYLNQFDLLKSYINRSGTPFQLAAGMPASEFVKKDVAFSTLLTNFDAVDLNGSYNPLNTLKVDGTYDFNGMHTAANVAAEAGVVLYGGVLCSEQGQRTAYYNKLIEPIDIPVETETGTIINFEDDNLGATYPMTNGGKNAVVTDPDGESGKVLQIVHANQSFPKFHVKLKEGLVLGDYTGVTMDMRLNAGQYGVGLRVVINGTTFEFGRNAADYGFSGGQNTWKRGGIYVKFVKEGTYTASGGKVPAGTIEIPNTMKDLTEVKEFSLGSASGDWDAYIDNLTFTWEVKPQHIEKTPEEKAEIFTKEMEKWIGGMVYAGVNELNSVKAWNIISNPLDKTVNENTFKWSEYLGDEGYARTAIKIARDTVKNVGVKLELFVSQTLNQYDEMSSSADKLIALVNAWEGDNISKIDGYNILLSSVYSKDANFQKGNETMISELFEKLSKTGKLVRVSNLSMMVEDTNGNYIATNKMSEEDKAAAISYMAFIMQEYRKHIPLDKQFGISISSMTETSTGYKLTPWTSNYNRSVMYEGIIKGLISK
ncbi:endo-1,4-beta-xylanase [Bacteroides reticulotermitis]|uniref:endo-1,4-beta-xylanase n=1 Tax=Bacteroides reticulotermitis TaxID=1133319 RepID=UPI003A8806D8